MSLESERHRWEKEILNPARKRFPERKKEFKTPSGILIPPILNPDYSEEEYLEQIGFPGEYPFTRGVQPTMYRGRFWTMRQYAGYASAEESNQRYRYLLEHGQMGLSVAFDLPTQIGYDSDDPIARGEVGKVGVAISSLEDMETLFRDIPLSEVSTSMTINAPAAILLAMYIAVAKRQGVDIHQLRGTTQNDILKEYIARGTYIFPPEPSMRLITEIFSYCQEEIPRWNTISISGYHIREAGSTAVQEIAFTMANAIAYVEAALAAGLEINDFAKQLSFFFNSHNNFIEEVAKFRAARRLWARLMSERFKASDPSAMTLRFHTQTAGSTLTAQQPENNAVRVAVQALAAVMGGTQSLHTNSMDEALGLPTEKRSTWLCEHNRSLRTSLVLETVLTLWQDRIWLNTLPMRSRMVPRLTLRRSMKWAVPWLPSSKGISSARSKSQLTNSNNNWKVKNRLWLGSIRSRWMKYSTLNDYTSIRRSKLSNANVWQSCEPGGITNVCMICSPNWTLLHGAIQN